MTTQETTHDTAQGTTAPAAVAVTGTAADREGAARRCPFALSASQVRLAEGGRQNEGHFGGDHGLVLTGYDDIREMLAGPDFTAVQPPFPAMSSEVPPGWFFGMDPPQHTAYRKRLAGAFSVRTVRGLRPMVERVADGLLDAVEQSAERPVDLMESYCVQVPTRVVQHLLGVSDEHHARFRAHMRAIVTPEVTEDISTERLGAVQRQMWDDMAAVVREKRLHPRDDLMSAMQRPDADDGPLSEAEAVGMAMTLMIAGNEAMENLLGMAVFVLLSHPDQLAALRAGPGTIGDAVEEFLRFLPINNFGAVRTAARDCTVGGRSVRAGQVVVGLLSTANRDAARFDDPDRLDTGHDRRSHLAFGHGVHQCLGAHLARLQVEVGVLRLLDRFPHLRLADRPEEVRMRESVGFYGVDELRVVWDRPA